MKWRSFFLALATGAAACLLVAQEVTTKQTTVQTREGQTVTITGEVVRYEPGQMIELRQPDRRVVTYTIGPGAVIPEDIQIGRSVTVATEPSSSGSGPAIVTRVTTTSINPQGQTKTTTEKTETTAEGDTTKTTTTTISGTVSAYEPGHSITILEPNRQTVTYTITQESQLPQELAIGKTVTIRTMKMKKGSPVVKEVTITKTRTSSD